MYDDVHHCIPDPREVIHIPALMDRKDKTHKHQIWKDPKQTLKDEGHFPRIDLKTTVYVKLRVLACVEP